MSEGVALVVNFRFRLWILSLVFLLFLVSDMVDLRAVSSVWQGYLFVV